MKSIKDLIIDYGIIEEQHLGKDIRDLWYELKVSDKLAFECIESKDPENLRWIFNYLEEGIVISNLIKEKSFDEKTNFLKKLERKRQLYLTAENFNLLRAGFVEEETEYFMRTYIPKR